jgi:hypothetical protein
MGSGSDLSQQNDDALGFASDNLGFRSATTPDESLCNPVRLYENQVADNYHQLA